MKPLDLDAIEARLTATGAALTRHEDLEADFDLLAGDLRSLVARVREAMASSNPLPGMCVDCGVTPASNGAWCAKCAPDTDPTPSTLDHDDGAP